MATGINYYSFFDGWDAGVKADRDKAAEEERVAERKRTAQDYAYGVPAKELVSAKAAAGLEEYLLGAEARRLEAKTKNALELGRQEAAAGELPDLLSMQSDAAKIVTQRLRNDITQGTYDQATQSSLHAKVREFPKLLDLRVRAQAASDVAAGVNVDMTEFGLPADKAAKMTTGEKISFLKDPAAYWAAQDALTLKVLEADLVTQRQLALQAARTEGAVELKKTQSGGKAGETAATKTPIQPLTTQPSGLTGSGLNEPATSTNTSVLSPRQTPSKYPDELTTYYFP